MDWPLKYQDGCKLLSAWKVGPQMGVCTMYNTYNCTERIIHHFVLILIATRLVLKYVDLHRHGMIFHYNNFCHDLNIIHYPMLQTRDAWTYLKSTAIACRSVLRFKRFDLVVILSAQ